MHFFKDIGNKRKERDKVVAIRQIVSFIMEEIWNSLEVKVAKPEKEKKKKELKQAPREKEKSELHGWRGEFWLNKRVNLAYKNREEMRVRWS